GPDVDGRRRDRGLRPRARARRLHLHRAGPARWRQRRLLRPRRHHRCRRARPAARCRPAARQPPHDLEGDPRLMSETTQPRPDEGTTGDDVSGAEIVFDDVVKTYPGMSEPAVNSLSLTVPAGEIVMFVGPSGCGKTTTLKMINRLHEPTSGTITIDGADIR